MARRLLAEFVGTFALVFAGTGAIVVNDEMGGVITHVGIALVFGLVVMAMIYAVGDISGAHFNPAVTVGFALAGRLRRAEVILYIVSQSGGALLASLLLRVLFPVHATLGATLPTGGVVPAFVFEVVMTFFLMFVIIRVATSSKDQGLIGATVTLDALFGGPISGASTNPALVAWQIADLWLYLVAPLLGAALAIGIYRGLHPSHATPQTLGAS